MGDLFNAAKVRAAGRIARNAAQLATLPQRMSAIYKEEDERARRDARAAGVASAQDNRFDAERHARASARMTEAVGPRLAALAGYAVEGAGLARNLRDNLMQTGAPEKYRGTPSVGEAVSAMKMDIQNNAEGRRAALEGRPIDPARLRMAPERTSEYAFLYDARSPRRHTTAGR